jgi:hypothetical protein
MQAGERKEKERRKKGERKEQERSKRIKVLRGKRNGR